VRSSLGAQARGRTPGWPEGSRRKDRWDCSQGGARSTHGKGLSAWPVLARTSCPLQHLPPVGAAVLCLPASSSPKASGPHGLPWTSYNIKQGHTPHTLPHLGRILQANGGGKGRDKHRCTTPVSWVSADVMLFSLSLPTPTLHYLL